MRIAILSPLYESVPPILYGGTERVVSYLTEELVRAGHDVTLFASGDSKTKARLIPACQKSLRLDQKCLDPLAHHFLLMEEVIRRQKDFDIIHSNVGYIGLAFGRRISVAIVETLHGRLDIKEVIRVFREYREFPLVSISNAQRAPAPDIGWIATVYHGIPEALYSLNETRGEYIVFVGRISPEKKVDSAIEIALKSAIPLKIAAKVDAIDREYFQQVIRPMLKNNPLVEYLGELTDKEKNTLLGSAMALVHPVDWPEPFGLAMIEAMACGVPVVARKRGSIPEVVDHGKTGFIFEEDDEAVFYLKNHVSSLSKRLCREHFEKRYSSARMARDYLDVYNTLLKGKEEAQRSAPGRQGRQILHSGGGIRP